MLRRFVRLNNHEHTDIAEYIGTYVADASGGITFVEGVLVSAVRNGHWIVLDELNLAPSDVLEALNRLLDDNRELFVPELQQTVRQNAPLTCCSSIMPAVYSNAAAVELTCLAAQIKPHPHFMLFATQNPPGAYGGRKVRCSPTCVLSVLRSGCKTNKS